MSERGSESASRSSQERVDRLREVVVAGIWTGHSGWTYDEQSADEAETALAELASLVTETSGLVGRLLEYSRAHTGDEAEGEQELWREAHAVLGRYTNLGSGATGSPTAGGCHGTRSYGRSATNQTKGAT